MRWDLFCRVIDNHGDAGVCWRVAAELAARGETVRLWMDDSSMLAWMAPQRAPGVEVLPWRDPLPHEEPGDVAVEAFGCDPPPAFVARMAAGARPPAWINLEYLSAEGYVERSHGLPSPVMSGPGAGLTKHFFYPGFSTRTGGLLRERDLAARRAGFDRAAWRRRFGIAPGERVVSLFCYEPAALPQLLAQLAAGEASAHLLVTSGRAAAAVRAAGARDTGNLRLHWLPLLAQRAYDELLWSCDLNFVRGEDSVVRGLLAGVPLLWQVYPQDDLAHHAKLEAFLAWLQPPADQRDFFLAWNGVAAGPLPPIDLAAWNDTAVRALAEVDALPELATELVRFAAARATI
ncbi:elongation factor P maturation arginine rhamnosyltransferase EarP [Ramlibacter sp. USB13]|uniref:Protein-arginine rhamnosyltransferase n=1 Tax=Ramlibacter cellulosilyticus TaxID=2764187 RepID=A0A923SDB3_9BURK|nr:elongation factor P maturation arginine rhamnosyltransferase EarP [Ramlibacter cellulosilyticus]MBC5785830.1 elongation factor P maturation arginine rhamnosyltransferase EarP [Ramlibacter cellulosilyticus]